MPVPQAEIHPTPAPGKTGPHGIGPRTNYSRVNTGAVEPPAALASAQKVLSPRGLEMLPDSGGGIVHTGSALERPRLQDMVKAAMRSSIARLDVTREALRQAENMGEKAAAKTVLLFSRARSSLPVSTCHSRK